MSKIALNAISITLGSFFIFYGLMKLCPIFTEDLYRDMRKIFMKYDRVFPLKSLTHYSPSPHSIRRVFGSLEVVCGLLMTFCPGIMSDLANMILLLIMLAHVYFSWCLKDGLKETSHAIVFGLLLLCRIIIKVQLHQRKDLDKNENCEKFVQQRIRELTKKYNCLHDQINDLSGNTNLKQRILSDLDKNSTTSAPNSKPEKIQVLNIFSSTSESKIKTN